VSVDSRSWISQHDDLRSSVAGIERQSYVSGQNLDNFESVVRASIMKMRQQEEKRDSHSHKQTEASNSKLKSKVNNYLL
jgi:hypothetical protein